jgi:hypothetical protein
MTTDELERAAYARGDVTVAGLLARIADLQAALGRATARIVTLEEDLRAARYVERYERAYPGDPD